MLVDGVLNFIMTKAGGNQDKRIDFWLICVKGDDCKGEDQIVVGDCLFPSKNSHKDLKPLGLQDERIIGLFLAFIVESRQIHLSREMK